MKTVRFRFSNIQSHESTTFTLEPGLNFILADDNNVGKSTIFKALTMMAKMPRAADGELHELLRSGATTGYISMDDEDTRVTFWLNRDGDRVRAFFEIVSAGVTTRSATCPSFVLDSLDIVLGSDGLPINFNDADSVQLIVQDTAKNDEVLSKVLIDVTVDAIKQNAAALDKQVQQDYRIVEGRYSDSQGLLARMQYNDAVDNFFSEQDLLYALVRVSDCLDKGCLLDSCVGSLVSLPSEFEAGIRVLDVLHVPEIGDDVALPDDVDIVDAACHVIECLDRIDASALSVEVVSDISQKLDNIERCTKVLEQLRKAEISASFCATATQALLSCKEEEQRLCQFLSQNFQVVSCPMKGEVYYSETECVPVND